MHRLGIAVAVVLAGLALLALWFTADGGPSDGGAGARSATRAASAPVRTGESIVHDEATRVAVSPKGNDAVGLTAPVAELRVEAMLTVRVIDATTGLAVPAATVHTLAVVPDAILFASDFDDARQRGLEDCVVRFGLEAACDERGEAKLPRPRGLRREWRQVYVARAGDRFGRRALDEPRATELVVRIDRDRHVDVDVVDALGRPAPGVAVVHHVVETSAALPTGKGWSVLTNEDGRARVSHLQTHVIAQEQSSVVGVEAPGLPVAPMPLDCLAPPLEPIRLQLPQRGAIEVIDEGPAALTEGQELLMHALTKDGSGARAPCRGGRARFPFVGLGLEFALDVVSRAGPRRFRFKGPTRMDETVTFTVPARGSPLLGIRIVDAEGGPVAGVMLEFEVEIGAAITRTARIAAHDGCCCFALDAAARGQTMHRVRVSVPAGPLAGSRGELTVDRVVADFLELGDLRVEDAPLWAEGRALDDGSVLVSDLDIRLEVASAEQGAGAPAIRMLDEGRFELRGGEGVRSVRLSGGNTSDGAEQLEAVTANAGATDLVVRLVRRASLSVEFVHEPGRVQRLGVVLHQDGGQPPIDASMFARATERGTSYRFDRVPVGTYRFAATLLGETAPIFAVDGVVLRAGENRDPRLQGIALSGVRVLRVEIGAAPGTALPDFVRGSIWVRRDSVWYGRDFMSKRVDLVARPEPVDVLVAVTGFAPARFERVTGDLTVELATPQVLSVELVVDGWTPDRSEVVYAQLEPLRASSERYAPADAAVRVAPGPDPWRWPSLVQIGMPREVPHDGPGEYRLRVFVAGGFDAEHELRDFSPKTVTIPASGALLPITLSVPASAFAR
ncbi:MAG: hypothetical protein HZB39_02930 [Planctomycetes bacterium]|nr:hypothetical protein [Planctomycetota bacterium]